MKLKKRIDNQGYNFFDFLRKLTSFKVFFALVNPQNDKEDYFLDTYFLQGILHSQN